jgi:hypothetical protein
MKLIWKMEKKMKNEKRTKWKSDDVNNGRYVEAGGMRRVKDKLQQRELDSGYG